MISANGFVDLRLNRGSQTDESFWPSFTDIMMVIVIIFLMALVIMLLRNIDLVEKLRATMAAERQAAQVARATAEEKDALAARLDTAENELSALRLRMLLVKEERDQSRRQLKKTEQALATTSTERDRLSQQAQQLSAEKADISERLRVLRAEHTGLQTEYAQLQATTATAQKELSRLRAAHAQQSRELAALHETATTAGRDLAQARSAFSALKIKYDKLVKPARTSRGKYVVEVRYAKQRSTFRIQLKRPGDTRFQTIGLETLHSRLGALKQAHPNRLYVKIIIPEDSGLTYNEAWTFTTDLLNRYDYYYQ